MFLHNSLCCNCESGSAAFEAVHPLPRVETTAEGSTPLQAIFPHSPGEPCKMFSRYFCLRNQFGNFLLVVQLIHRLTQADISYITTARSEFREWPSRWSSEFGLTTRPKVKGQRVAVRIRRDGRKAKVPHDQKKRLLGKPHKDDIENPYHQQTDHSFCLLHGSSEAQLG